MKHKTSSSIALLAAALALSLLTACAAGAASSAAAEETLLGQVTAGSSTGLEIDLLEETASDTAESFAESMAAQDTAPDNESRDGQPPEKPDEAASGNAAGTPPELPAGNNAPGGMHGYSATGKSRTLTLSEATVILAADGTEASAEDLAAGTIVEVTVRGDTAVTVTIRNTAMPGSMGGQTDGAGESRDNGTAATTYDSDTSLSGESYASSSADENALRVTSSATVTLTSAAIDKTGGTSSQDASNFYGMNAGALAEDGATLHLNGATVTTDASGANGVFAYGTGTVNVSDTKIRTAKDNSGGIEVAGGGTLYASNLDVQTEGNSAAAIRSDRGGGTETVDGGTYTTNGTGSPAVYCTADVSVSNAALTANHSEAVVVEGKNSVTLTNCTAACSMDGTYGTDGENIHGVMIYQSMSGDAEEGQAQFTMDGGSLAAAAGDLFYVTNTSCVITLNNALLDYDTTCNLLTVAGNNSANGWGTQGENGGRAVVNCTAQTLAGNIAVDEISTLNLTLSAGSSLTGSINSTDSGAAAVAVTLDDTSSWTLTDDCYLTEFNGSTSCIAANGHHVYVNGETIA